MKKYKGYITPNSISYDDVNLIALKCADLESIEIVKARKQLEPFKKEFKLKAKLFYNEVMKLPSHLSKNLEKIDIPLPLIKEEICLLKNLYLKSDGKNVSINYFYKKLIDNKAKELKLKLEKTHISSSDIHMIIFHCVTIDDFIRCIKNKYRINIENFFED